ncbi:hypothetical protein BGW36DRAFT_23334 [Talaromyces proteolyticus]|uniref:Rhodopsin domain-containing protein n=1 Tax=Talaromyces proteolyticus TaxID=1131652 RepID=A0AAD4KHW2_9EURO|nr:uncharacterized protein BGW36DRAFT_23334 [Talaromyces proteolyticus]KAH8692618.1 hypothetical protein BGW36DRAFT_23334 [Talaromyces proteolyticus]
MSNSGNTDINLHENKGPNILAPMWALTMITTTLVCVRIFIRARIVKALGVDDWTIMVSMVMGLVYLGLTTANVITGYGRHAKTLDMAHLEKAILLNTVGFLFGILSFTLPKIAVAFMLTRILNPSKGHKAFVFGLVGFAAVVSVVCILILFTMCTPPQSLWVVTIPGRKCRDSWILIDYAVFTGALSAFVDLYLAIYPSVVLWKLKMSSKKKMALSAALGLGVVAAAMAIVKCTQLKGLADTADYTFGTWQLVIWTNVEADVVVIASCIPTLPPLLELVLGKKKKGSSYNYNSRYFNRLDKDNQGMNGSNSIEMRGVRSKQHSISVTNVEGQDSQESILSPDHRQQTDLNQIRRTDNVTVQYERNEHARVPVGAW